MSHSHENNPRLTGAEQLLEEAETLIWALLDDQLDEAGAARLSQLIKDDETVRARYIDCVQLHVDLHEHFGQEALRQKSAAVVLPNLFPGLAGLEGFPQVVD